MKTYTPLLTSVEDQTITKFLTVEDTKNFIRRVRGVNFMVKLDFTLSFNSENSYEHKFPTLLDVSARQIQVILSQVEMFNSQVEMFSYNHDPAFQPEILIKVARYGDFVCVG